MEVLSYWAWACLEETIRTHIFRFFKFQYSGRCIRPIAYWITVYMVCDLTLLKMTMFIRLMIMLCQFFRNLTKLAVKVSKKLQRPRRGRLCQCFVNSSIIFFDRSNEFWIGSAFVYQQTFIKGCRIFRVSRLHSCSSCKVRTTHWTLNNRSVFWLTGTLFADQMSGATGRQMSLQPGR